MEIQELVKRGYNKKLVVKLKDMKNFFSNKKAIAKKLKNNPLIYTVFMKKEKDTEYTITIIEPGKIGKEHFMTRGHYHTNPYPEIYILLKGKGLLLLQNKKFKKIKLKKGKVYYVSPGYAHRAVNLSWKKLEFLTVCSCKAKHDYKKIEKKGFKHKF